MTKQGGVHKRPCCEHRLYRIMAVCFPVLMCFTGQSLLLANPMGGEVVSGQASFNAVGNTLTVTNTPGTIINWQGFSINANEVTRFAQQSAASAVLNRVITNNPSVILGTLSSNGQVFLVNPGGIVFGAGSTVDVAGLVATSLNLSDADFLAGRHNFTSQPGAQNISNAGNITAQQGGQIYLIAPNVENTGVITAPNGEILLAAGHEVQLVNSLDPGLRVSITAPAGDATNLGKLIVESGSLGLFGTVVRNTGTVSADSAVMQGGRIVFKASQRAEISGTVTANGTTGGTIQALGNEMGIMDGATVSANGTQGGGTVLIGGDYQGSNPDVQNAQVTYVAPTANISTNGGVPSVLGPQSSALGFGNGGKIIVWADDTARIYGSISATGGAVGGNGGFVETSGKRYLDVTSAPNVFAPAGRGGQWLLDPRNVTIQAGPGNMDNIDITAPYFIPAAIDNSTLDVAVINAALNAETTIEVTTGGTGIQLGTITVAAPITKTAGVGAGSLFLTAANEIFINADITASSGQIQFFTAATQVDVNANITLNGGAWDATGGGATVLINSGAPIINSPLYTGAVNISAGTATFNGNMFLTNLTLSGGTLTGSGAINIPNTGTLNWTNGVIGGGGTLTTQAGSTTSLAPGFAQTVALQGSRVWDNFGTVTFTPNAGTLSFFQIDDTTADGTAVFNNQSGAQFNINASFNDTHTIGVGTFNNAGALNKNLNGSAATSGFAPAFNNQSGGLVNVNSGTLRFDTGGTDAGNYVLTNGATLQFHGGPRSISGNIGGSGNVTFSKPLTATAVYTLTGDYNISGATTAALDSLGTGTLAFNGTVTNLGTSYIQSGGVTNVSFAGMTSGAATGFQNLASIAVNDGSVTFANGTNFGGLNSLTQAGGGTLDFGNNPISVSTLNMTGGTLTGSGNLTVTTGGSFNWGGSLNATIAGSGALTTQSGVTTNITPGFARTTSLRGSRVWDNFGTVTFTPNAGTLSFFEIDNTTADGTAVFNNKAGGLFNVNASFTDTHTIGVGIFNNEGEFRKSLNTSVATSVFAPTFNNMSGGTVNVNSGTLSVTGALTQSGTIEVAAGTTFLKTGGFSNSISGTLAGAGTISVGVGNSLGNSGTISPGMTGGDATETLSIIGNLSMNASSILNIDINSPLAGDYDVLQLNPGMAGNLAGTLNLSGVAPAGSYSIFSSTGGMFGTFATVNSGTFTQTPTYDTGNQLVTLTVTANTNVATAYWTGIAADFNWATAGNWSTGIAPIAGDKVYIGGGAGTVSYTPTAGQVGAIVSDGALNFVAGDLTVANASTFNGAASFNGGTLTLNGGSTFNSVSVASAASALTLNGPATSVNSLNISAGSLTFGGPSTVNKMNMTGGTLTDNYGFAINGSFDWSGGAITSANGSIFTTSVATTTTITGNAVILDNIWHNNGRVNFNGTGNLSLGGAGVAATTFINQANGVLNLNGSSTTPIQWGTIITNKAFLNFGTLNKNGGSAATQTLDLLSGNAGTVKVQSGTLALPNFITNDGMISVASGAIFSTGAFTNSYYWNGSIWVTGVLEGAGAINVGAGTITNNGIIAPGFATGDTTGTLSITGNVLMGATGQLNLDLDGTVAGNYDVLNVSGTADITTATINLKGFGGAGAYTVLTTGGLTGPAGMIYNGYFTQTPAYTANNLSLGVTGNTLANAIFWDGGAGTYNWADALNWSTNVVPAVGDNVYVATQGANSILVNSGVQQGNNLVCDALFQLAGGSLTLGGISYFNGAASISGGTLNTAGAAYFGTWNWTGGTITGTGALNVSNLSMPAGTTLNGVNATSLDGKTMNVNGNTGFSSGAANGSNGADLTLLNGAIINNKGIWSVDNIANIVAGTGGGTFNNFGEVRIGQTVAATATIGTVFNNDNSIFIDLIHGANINNGSLTISGGGTSIFDSFNTLAGATIGYTNGYTFDVATDFGAGTLNLAGGAVNATGALSADSITISGPVTSNGDLTLQAVSGINQGFGSSITANGIVTISSSTGMIDLPAITSTVTGLPDTTAAINVDATNSWLYLNGHLTTTSGGIRLTASGTIDLDFADNFPTLVTAAGDVFIQSVNSNITALGAADISGANVVLDGLTGVDAWGAITATTGSVQAVSVNGAILFRDATSAATGVSAIAGGNIVFLNSFADIMTSGGNVLLNSDSDGLNGGAIVMNTGSSIISNGGNVTFGGGIAGNGTGNAIGDATYIDGIYLTGATINAGGGNITLNGTGFAGTSLTNGIYATNTSVIQTSGNGAITLNGIGGAGTGDNNGVRIGTSTSISSVNGLISLTGQGGASAGTLNMGVYVHNNATVTATGTGGITLNGTGGSSSATNHNTGIAVQSGATISVASGALSLFGTSGAGTGTYNRGVNIQQGTVLATGTGSINITGYSNATATSSFGRGVELREGGLVQSASGVINITGSCFAGSCGLGTSSNEGIYIHDATAASGFGAGKVLSTSGAITLTGSSWGAGASNYGIHLFNDTVLSSVLSASVDSGVGGSSNISLVSPAGDIVLDTGTLVGVNTSGNLSLNAGRDIIFNTALIRAVGGNATFSVNNNILFSASSSLASSSGALNVNLYSDFDGATGGGIYLDTGSSINSNGGNITMGGMPSMGYAIGNGTVTGGKTFNSGIYVLGDITAGAGNVIMRGEGRAFGSGSNHLADGITFAGGLLSSNGAVTIDGLAHVLSETTVGTEVTAGVDFLGGGTRLSTQTGTVTVTGLNDAGAGFCRGQGITVGAGTIIETTGIGTLTLNGTSTGFDTGWGVGIFGGTVQTTATGGGAVTLNGINVTNPDGGVVIWDGHVLSGGGAINLIGQSSGSAVGMLNTVSNALMLGGPNSGNITIRGAGAGTDFIDFNPNGGFAHVINAGSSALSIISGQGFTLNNVQINAGDVTLNSGGLVTDNNAATSFIVANTLRLLGAGSFNLGSANNNVATLAANVTGNAAYNDTNGFAIGSVTSFDGTAVTATTGVTTGNANFTGTTTGNITLNTGGVINAGTGSVVLAATGNFMNNSGSATPITANSGRIYSASPSSNTKGGMVPAFSIFNCTYPGACGAPATGVGFLYTQVTAPILTIIADALSKVYGSSDPALTYAVSGLVGDDLASIVTGAQSRVAGENAGTYAISQGALSVPAGYGYTVAYTGSNLTITPALLTVNLSASNASKTYGTALIFTGTEFTPVGLIPGDTITGVTLTSTGAAGTANAGAYSIDITPGSEVFGQGLASNYNIINYIPGTLTVNPAPLTVSANAQSKVYGNADPALTYTSSGLLFTDTLTGSLSRVAGENVGSYAIMQGTLANPNYNISYTGNNLGITQRIISIIASASSKVYGSADPNLFTVGGSGLASWDTNGTAFTGSLSHTGGENVVGSPYAITQGSLAANLNYSVSGFTGNNLTITPAPLVVAGVPVNKVLGTPDPQLTYTTSGLQFGETPATTLSGTLVRDPGDTIGTYLVNQGTLALLSTNYTMTYVPCNFTILAPTVVQEITQMSLQNTPQENTAATTAGDETTTEDEKKQAAQAAAEAEVVADAGGAMAEPLPVCQ